MASKRKYEVDPDDDKIQELLVSNKKHTLDSDEEDSDDYEKDNDSEIDGEEDGIAKVQDDQKITPFNMREELEEGHFDKEGNYHWNKDSGVKDNWLDNIDWVKVKDDKNYLDTVKNDDSNDSLKLPDAFSEGNVYKQMLEFMQHNETVEQTLRRLNKSRLRITTAERLRNKKKGIVDEAGEKITKFTELTNEILTKTGNMDIYQEDFNQIKCRLNNLPGTSKVNLLPEKTESDTFDMYSDDFDAKEKKHLNATQEKKEEKPVNTECKAEQNVLQWEFKWKSEDDKLHGPYSTEQMLKWSQEKYFKKGVYVRKVGDSNTNFYSSNRIDFDLYL